MSLLERTRERTPVLATQRLLVVNADDFGMSHTTTRGVIEAHERGIVTSASLMVTGNAAEEAAEYARFHPRLGVGLHLDLCEWEYRDDEWHLLYTRAQLDSAAEVAAEVAHQLARFEELLGRGPSHIDTHQHVHREDVAGAVVAERARALGIPVRDLSPGVRYRGEFYGQSSKGEPYPDWITPGALIDLLASLAVGVSEVSCHPAIGSEEGDGYASERIAELDTLCAPSVLDAIVEHGISLVSFADVAPLLEHGVDAWRAALEARSAQAAAAGDHAEAVRWSRRAVDTEPDHVGSWLALSRACARVGDGAGAAAAVAEALRLQPQWASVLLQHADVLAAAGRRAEAAEVLSDVATRNVTRPDLLRRVVQRLSSLGVDERSLEVADKLLEAVPGDEEARLAKAAALSRRGRRREALEMAAGVRPVRTIDFMLDLGEAEAAWRLASEKPEGVPAALLVRTAQALRRHGHLTLAEHAFEAALVAAPSDLAIRNQREVLAGEHRVLREGFSAPARAGRKFRPRRGVVMHLVGHSSPHSHVGYAVRTDSIVRAQRAAGLEPHVVTRLGFPWDDGANDVSDVEFVDGIAHHRIRTNGGTPARLDDRLAEAFVAAERVARLVRPAVLHAATDYRNAVIALGLRESLQIPVVYEVRGFWEETRLRAQGPGAEDRECYRLHRERELDCMRCADHIVTLAEVMRDELVARGVPPDKIAVVPNAVDEHAFAGLCERDDSLAEQLGIRDGERVVGYVSSLSSYEGVEYLLDATALLRRAGWPARCLVVGEGEARAALEAYAAAGGDPDLAIFTGRVPHENVRSYYSLIDVFVVPRTAERVSQLVTPLKPYEAMANGRAIVVSRVPALTEMIIDGVTGLTFAPENAADLAAVVEKLFEQPARRAELARSARAWVLANRTWSRNGAAYAELYRALGAAA